MEQPQRVLLKLRPQTSLAAVERRANVRPLFETSAEPSAFGLTGDTAAWYIAEVPEFGIFPQNVEDHEALVRSIIGML